MGFLDKLRQSLSGSDSSATAYQQVPPSSAQAPARSSPQASNLAAELYAFGRFEIDPVNAPAPLLAVAQEIEPRYYRRAIADPAAFCRTVREVVEREGGWAAYGGMRLLRSLLGELDNPDFHQVNELGFAFLRSRNINFQYLSMVEIDWWVKHHGGGTYLNGRPQPPREGSVTALGPGERRKVAHMGPKGNNNDIYVYAADDQFHAVIVSPGDSWERCAAMPWFSYPDLFDLYDRVGEAFKSPPPWCDAEMAKFCPLDPPDFRP